MLTAPLSNDLNIPHEVVAQFEVAGFTLNKKLEGMLNEEPEHQRPRRGCGYTQASRLLSEFINQPRGLSSELDLRLFSESSQRKFSCMLAVVQECLEFTPNNIEELHEALKRIAVSRADVMSYVKQLNDLREIVNTLEFEESRLIARILLSILGDSKFDSAIAVTDIPELRFYQEKLAIGTCPEAERYFLEFSGGYLRRQGIINILTDESNNPAIIEKISVGDSHSCISLVDLRLNGVLIPAGSLLGTTYNYLPLNTQRCADMNGSWMPMTVCEGFRFLRLTTLSISPRNRARAFSNHLKKQLEGSPFFDPLNTTVSDLMSVALKQFPR